VISLKYNKINNEKEKWITCLHCICSNSKIFDSYIDNLSQEYNILLIDLPGHGENVDVEVISFKQVALNIIEILNKNNIEKTDIWAISLSAIITKEILKINSNKIGKVIFEGPAFTIQSKILRVAFSIFNRIKNILPYNIYLKIFIYVLLIGKKDLIKIINGHCKNTNKNTIKKWLELMVKEYSKNDFICLNKIEVQKKYIIGEKDFVFKSGVTKNIQNNEYNNIEILKNVGHLCHLERKVEIWLFDYNIV